MTFSESLSSPPFTWPKSEKRIPKHLLHKIEKNYRTNSKTVSVWENCLLKKYWIHCALMEVSRLQCVSYPAEAAGIFSVFFFFQLLDVFLSMMKGSS